VAGVEQEEVVYKPPQEEEEEKGQDGDDNVVDTPYFDDLPPEPRQPCDEELQSKIARFLRSYQATGFTPYLKSKKEFGNPEVLSKVVMKEIFLRTID